MRTRADTSLGSGFRALLTGSLISNIGDGIRLAALPLLAAGITDSPLLIASVTAAQYLPWLTFAPVGGALVDRSDRRRLILITQTWRGLLMAGLGVLVFTGTAEIWMLCVVAFLITVGEIMVDPATVALVPTLVDDEHLDRANGRVSSVEIATNDFAGGPVGSVLYVVAPWLPFVIDGGSYLGSVVAFGRLPGSGRRPDPVTRPDRTTSLRGEMAAGFLWLRRHEVLGPVTVAQVVYFVGFAPALALLVELVTDPEALDGSEAAFGIILALGAVGAFLGTFAGGPLATRFGPRLVLTGAVALQAVAFVAAAAAPSVIVLAVLWFAAGVPMGVQRPVSRSLQQRLTPNELLGRVNVTARMFTRGVIVIGSLAAGLIATVFSLRAAFALGGGALFVATFIMWSALGRLRDT